MDRFLEGFQDLPLWVEIALGFFALMGVVMFAEPAIRNRRARRQFDAIAQGLSASPPAGRGWPATFRITIADRAFDVRFELRSRGGGSYRGPTGLMLITATRLTNDRWPLHQVDIGTLSARYAWLFKKKQTSGDPEFDGRFLVVEDGLPVRERWLDEATRGEIERFFAAAPIPGLIWIREGELQFLMQTPWTRVDGPALRPLLEQQAALASALDRTAARRL